MIRAWILTLAVLVGFAASAQNPLAPAKHPVQQLVEWELTANSALSEEALREMAFVILQRADLNQIPESLLSRAQVLEFRKMDKMNQLKFQEQLTTEQVKQLVVLPAPLEYYEIPAEKLRNLRKTFEHELKMKGLDQAQNFVRFKKNGEEYFRWFLHPLAEESRLTDLMKEYYQLDLQKKSGIFQFHFTASRSLIVFTDSYDHAFSVKLSLPRAHGPFQKKSIDLSSFTAWGRHNAYLADNLSAKPIATLSLQYEPYGFGLSDVGDSREDGMLFRNLTELQSGRYLLPAFSILDEKIGAEIARQNGSADPLKFWEQNFLIPFAKALAELRVRTGAEHTSPHTQNVLVELDRNFKPTGRVVLRDFDFYIDDLAFKRVNRVIQETGGLTRNAPQPAYFNLRNGFKTLPSWMGDEGYFHWIESYFSQYKQTWADLTGLPLEKLFDSEGIKKYEFGLRKKVENRKYKTGPDANFHAIDFQKEFYETDYLSWLSQELESRHSKISYTSQLKTGLARVAEKAPPVPPVTAAPVVTVKGQAIARWSDFGQEFWASKSADELEGRLQELMKTVDLLDYQSRSKMTLTMTNLGLSQMIRNAKQGSAILELLELLYRVDPYFAFYLAKPVLEKINQVTATMNEIDQVKDLVAKGQKFAALLDQVKKGSAAEAKTAALGLYRIVQDRDALSQTAADALASRIKRETDPSLVRALMFELSGMSFGDPTVVSFLNMNLTKLSLDDQAFMKLRLKVVQPDPSVNQLLPRPAGGGLRCQAVFM